MKLLPNVYVSEVEGNFVAVATGKAAQKFGGMVQMNGTAAFVVNLLQKKATEEKLIKRLMEEYAIDIETSRRNVTGILSTLRETGWLEE